MSRFRNWKIKNEADWLVWSVEWWDGMGCYICSDDVPWWQVPYAIWSIFKEQRA